MLGPKALFGLSNEAGYRGRMDRSEAVLGHRSALEEAEQRKVDSPTRHTTF